MGTRADFYIGRGLTAEWLGSIAWDGFPASIPRGIRTATTARAYRHAVARMLEKRDDGTTAAQGWPWPWPDSTTTDYIYAYAHGKVCACRGGGAWFSARGPAPDGDDTPRGRVAVFPHMERKGPVALGPRSGLIVGIKR